MATFRGVRVLASIGTHSLKCNRLHQRRIVSLGLSSLCQVSVKKRALLDTCAVPVNKYDLSGVGILSPSLSTLFSTETAQVGDSSNEISEEDSEAGRVSKWPSPTNQISRQDVHSVFIGGYNFNHDVNYLKDLFSQFGEVRLVHVPLKRLYDGGMSQDGQYRYGFVTFTHAASFKSAIAKGSVMTGDGNVVDIKIRSISSRKLENQRTFMVNALPDKITVQQVHDYFKTFGDIELVNLVLIANSTDNTSKKQNYAFVLYKEGSDVQSLPQIEHHIGSTRIAVDKVGENTRKQSRSRCKTVLLENLSDTMSENDIKSHFDKIGAVTEVRLFADRMDNRTGFGIIVFEDKADALSAIADPWHDICGASVNVHLLGLLNE